MGDIFDWEKEDKGLLKGATTRIACKECLKIFVRPRVGKFDVIFITNCSEHEGWKAESPP